MHSTSQTRTAGLHRGLLLAGTLTLLLAAALAVRAPSALLGALTPDGALEPRTAGFLDRLRLFLGIGAAGLLAAGFHAGLRGRVAFASRSPPPSQPSTTRLPWLLGAGACALRLLLATQADIGLGDDGARVEWLQSWLEHPAPVWTGLWLPGHLYLHALVYLVVRDAVWAGVVLSALAAGGTTAILARALERDWGSAAAWFGGIAVSILPVALAYGATPDVNPVFAFFPVAAVAAVLHAVRGGGARWWAAAVAAAAWATWCRFDAIGLVPAIGLLLWPRWRQVVAFAVLGLVPFVAWNVLESLHAGQAGHVAQVVKNDPGLSGSLVSHVFSLIGAFWQSMPLPVALLALAGAVRAARFHRGRAWMLLGVLHAGALVATTLLFHAGTQPRYYILAGSVAAFYAAVGWGGIWAAAPRFGLAAAAVAGILLAVLPGLFPGGNDLWIRRSPRLRLLVDDVRSQAAERDVIWVSEESGYFYACRVRPPAGRYHSMPRADSDPAALLAALRSPSGAVVAVEPHERARERWQRLAALAGPAYDVRTARVVQGYQIYDMVRRTGNGEGAR